MPDDAPSKCLKMEDGYFPLKRNFRNRRIKIVRNDIPFLNKVKSLPDLSDNYAAESLNDCSPNMNSIKGSNLKHKISSLHLKEITRHMNGSQGHLMDSGLIKKPKLK